MNFALQARGSSTGQSASYHARLDEVSNDGRIRVLDFWRAVELLSPQKLPKADPANRDYPVLPVDPQHTLPWLAPGWGYPIKEGETRRFVLYVGTFSLRAFRSILVRKFGKDDAVFDRQRGGSTSLFAVQVTEDGRPLFDSLIVASCPWALSQTLSPGPQDREWLNGFDDWKQGQRSQLERQWAVPQDDAEGLQLLGKYRVGRRLEHADISEAIRMVANSLRVGRILKPQTGLIAASVIPKNLAFEPSDFDFLNSFYAEDLAGVASEVKAGNVGAALSRVLLSPGDMNEAERVDVRRSPETIWGNLAPQCFPRGRWPASVSESPYFSQQFAINSVEEAAVFGVNGPPGTGKTTLLRELVSTVIVKRAQALAALHRPSDAFEGEVTWKSERYTRTVSLWKPEFRGFEIVVASNNNRAVENITLEIPSAAAIAHQWGTEIDYFADFATRLQRKTKGGGEAWALIAARFGNKKNRKQFRDNFWYKDNELEHPDTRADQGFAEYLRTVKTKPSSWKDAVRAFEAALETELQLRSMRSEAWAAISTVREASGQVAALELRCQELRASLVAAEEQVVPAESERDRAEVSRERATAKRKDHLTFKPTFVDAVFTLGSAYRDWSVNDAQYASQVIQAEAERARAIVSLEACEEKKRVAEAVLQSAQRDLAALQQSLREAREKIFVLKQQLGASIPEFSDWLDNSEARELSTPWSDEAWNRARTDVFLKALHLHRTFVECSSLRFRRNLWAAMDLLSGKIPSGIDQRSAESVWSTMFFIVPVISTTFASFHRLFAHLGRESLGWLLMDEAGQTAPQAAIGAIWRSKRVIATGDPQQIEPIVSLPYTSQESLRKHFDVDEMWIPSQSSAQELIDRASRYGTYLQLEVDPELVWVGCPLRVHRRCERPMFDISNRVAYNGQMVYATPWQPPISLSPSRWLHIASEKAEGHWIPDEGLMLTVLLTELLQSGLRRESILLISPFRAVALKLRQIAKNFGVRRAGTIHVAQGAEADVVILVLGAGDPASDAAREWASDKPNLLNVAVSRAKRRIYVIGNRDLWGRLPYFSEAAEQLANQTLSASV